MLFLTIWLALASAWFFWIMYRNPRSLWSGASFLFFLFSLAVWILGFLFANSGWIMDHQLVYLTLVGLLILATVAIFLFPAILVITFFVEGIRNIRREGLRFANCLSLIFGILLLIYLFIWPLVGTQSRMAWQTLLYLIVSVPVAYLLAIFTVFCFSAVLNLIHIRKDRHLDQVVVLGAGIFGDQLTPLLKARIDRGIQVMNRNPGSVIILSGGQGPGEDIPEGEAMAEYVRQQGVDPDRILVEDKSLNTEQNLLYSRQLFRGPRTAIVSSGYHVFRALLLARNLGIPTVGYGARTRWYFTLNAVLREYAGYLKMTWKKQLTVILLLLVPVLLGGLISLIPN